MTPPPRPRPFCRTAARRAVLTCGSALVLILAGCNKSLIAGQNTFRNGDVAGAAQIYDAYAKGEGQKPKNRVIAMLELGAAQQALGDFDASNQSLAQAQQAMDVFDQRPEVSLSTETRALLINLNELPYRGWDSDRVMAATLRALNFLFLHDPGSARPSLNRAYRHQQEAVARNAKELEAAQAAATQLGRENNVPAADAPLDRLMHDPKVSEQVGQRFTNLERYAAFAPYVNPFSVLLSGLFFTHFPADPGDRQRAVIDLERAAGMAPDNPFVVDALTDARRVAAGGTPTPAVHVFFAPGTSPRLDAIYLELPTFLVSRRVTYVAANFPRLVENNLLLDRVRVSNGTQTVAPEPMASLDAVVGREFKERLPALILKSSLSAAIKAAASYAVNDAVIRSREGNGGRAGASTEDQLVVLLAQLATLGYQAATNQADQRIWASLPKRVDYARLPTPDDGVVEVTGGSSGSVRVELDPRISHGVWIRSVHPQRPLIVQTFPFGVTEP